MKVPEGMKTKVIPVEGSVQIDACSPFEAGIPSSGPGTETLRRNKKESRIPNFISIFCAFPKEQEKPCFGGLTFLRHELHHPAELPGCYCNAARIGS